MGAKRVTRWAAEELRSRRAQGEAILPLDVRTPDARVVHPYEIPGSRWLPLSEVVDQAAALPRGTAIVTYCTWPEDASSARAALWLSGEGFESVFVLENGLEAWKDAGFPTLPVDPEALPSRAERNPESADASTANFANAHTHAFLPGLVENYANRHELPIKRELTVLFVDIADSTPAILGVSPEEALRFVQHFMGIVTEAALTYCGDVKDYEGDGALLYFESATEATQAALSIREALAAADSGAGPPLRARLSLDIGDIVIGVIGTAMRRSVALIGPSINLAARLLKQIPPDGIIATEAVVEKLRTDIPALAERFSLLDEKLELKGFEKQYVRAYAIR